MEKDTSTTTENQTTIKLVNGKYSAEEALDLLNSLISTKIDFHKIKDFSTEIRFGRRDEHSRKQMEELTVSKTFVNAFIKENRECRIKIQGNISIQLIK